MAVLTHHHENGRFLPNYVPIIAKEELPFLNITPVPAKIVRE